MSTLLCHSVVYFQSLLALFFAIHIVTPFVCTTTFMITRVVSEKESDEVALRAFKSNIILDPQGVFNSWNDSQHFCEWSGVTCGRRHKRVTRPNLASRGLSGTLSSSIGNLSFLREIHFQNNGFQGEIPREFGRLFRLRVLRMENNTLVGQIPTNLSHCSKLTELELADNKLSGKLSLEFGSLYNLQILSIHVNHLTGVIPPFLGNLTSLKILSATENAFEGNIPESFGQLKQLSSLGLGGNNLNGTVPLSLYNLSFLANFSVSMNQLHGTLPPNFGLTLPNLQLAQLSMNLFSGSIPLSLSNASKLQRFAIVGNYFSGKLSVDFGGMQHLERLKLSGNNLGSGDVDEMSFINSLANCSKLWSLTASMNQFKGTLPPSIANLSQLQRIDFGQNQLYGTIPSGIGNLVNLYDLSLSVNQFTSPIPKEIAKIPNLQSLELHDNQFSEEIPFVLGNLSSLFELHLSNNKFSGVIPSSLGNLKQLSILNLFQNDLTGTIPEEIFNITHLSILLNLARNHLVGPISPKIGDLKNLLRFDVSDNNLTGQIPNEVGSCVNLEYLYMENNFFSGSLPPSLSSLKGIRKIDLSRNNLSGQISKSLETLLMLENLNLSFNNLEGEVPMKGIFANASAISVAGNSNKLCGGITQLQLPKCVNNNSKKEKTIPIFKILISIVGSFLGLIMLSFFIFRWLRRRRANQAFGIGPTLRKAPMTVSYERLLKATNKFSLAHLIGEGSFGSVYKGILDGNGTIVAIKVINLQCQGASKSFMAECKALRNIRHRNLVRVITCCSSIDFEGNDFKAIVYEFMPNGSLEKWLHPTLEHSKDKQLEIQSLTLLRRINIAIDVASALYYLHHHCQEPICHCDLKPSNVLLDGDMTAHVGDFGLARFFPEISNVIESSSIGVKGTIGYTAPEYGLGSNTSTNGDIYSYGILLLEMVTRKRPTDLMFGGDFNLHNFAKTALPNQVMDIVDPMLLNEEVNTSAHKMIQAINNKKECLISMVRVGVACSMESPQDRMNISHVIHELRLVKNSLLEPTSGFKLPRVQCSHEEVPSSSRQ